MKTQALIALAAVAVLSTPHVAYAADGVAYDSVTKFSTSGPASPGDFAADFATASKPAPAPHTGGMFGSIAALGGMVQNAMATFTNGLAERHFIAGQFRRTDEVAAGTATITDCRARTLTTLDLNKKTYRVTSLDSPPSSAAPAPAAPGRMGPPPTIPPDAHFDMTVTTTSLGPQTVYGMPSTGYTTHIVTTSTENGKTQSGEFDSTMYVSAQPEVASGGCASGMVPSMGPPSAAMMQGMTTALMAAHSDGRFTVHSSGPAIPSGRFSPYVAISPKSGGNASGSPAMAFSMIQERANLRSISDGDPVFKVPSDFTQIP